jgi:hypothetical protein
MKMAWKSDKSPGARRAKRAMLARREARAAFQTSMEDAFDVCSGYLNGTEKKPKEELDSDFLLYAYYKFRELRHKEKMPKKYSDMADLYREICLSQDSCAEARESRQGLRFACAQVVKGCGAVR